MSHRYTTVNPCTVSLFTTGRESCVCVRGGEKWEREFTHENNTGTSDAYGTTTAIFLEEHWHTHTYTSKRAITLAVQKKGTGKPAHHKKMYASKQGTLEDKTRDDI